MGRILLLILLLGNSAIGQINLTQGLVAHYPFNGNANDISGNNINGTVVNVSLTTDKNGNANSAYYFNASNSYIELPYSNLYNFAPQDSFSISVWVLPDQGYAWPAQAVVVKAPPHPDFTLSQWNYGSYILNYKAMSGYAYNHILNGTTTFITNPCWYNIITTYKNGIWKLYVNGILESSDLSQTRFILQDGSSKIAFGKKGESFGDFYKGKMDEIRLYNRVLNLQEIDSIFSETGRVRATGANLICSGTQVQLNAIGASIYSWSPTTSLNNPNISNPTATPVATIQYVVTGTSANGCISKDSVVITVNPSPIVTTSNDTTICQAGSAQLFASGGASYSWSPAATLSNPSISNPIATPSANTLYYVTVTGANSCSKIDSVNVNVRAASTFTINAPNSICPNGTIQLSAFGGDLYSWTPASSLNNPAISNPTASPSSTTTYSVQITDTLCNNVGNLSTTITVRPLPVINAAKSNDIDCSINQSQLSASGAAVYSWSPAGTLNNASAANPLATPAVTTQYVVTGTDLSGCVNSDSITVNVTAANPGSYLMPSAFTPNRDGLNDCYGIKYWGIITKLEFSIYNRWGERVFYTTQPGECWDGKYKGVPQTPNVFIYMIKASTNCGEVFRKGTFALIK